MKKIAPALLCVCLAVLFAVSMAPASLAQSAASGSNSLSAITISPGYTKMPPVALGDFPLGSPVATSGLTLIYPAGAATSQGYISLGNFAGPGGGAGNDSSPNGAAQENSGGNITGLMTVPTFQGAFATNGRVFNFNMIGNHPLVGGATTIPAHITSVSLELLNPDGSVNLEVPFAPFEDLTEDSPNFEEANYRSGRQTQFADAIQRAEFFNTMGDRWHTLLRPSYVDRITTQVPQFVNVQLPDGSIVQVPGYIVVDQGKPTQFVAMLDLLFNFLNFNSVVGEINAGNFTTDSFNMNLYPNTFLFSINAQGKIAQCCVLGFHNYIFENGVTPQPRWIFAFASWISPGIFSGGFSDVTALSHEISEAFNDPFGNNIVPTWQFPGVPANARVCQGNLETGDPVEVLANATVPITTREHREVFTYHPQTEALLQWFEMGTTSNAIDGAFSFPDETALTQSALPCPPPPPPAP